MRLLPTMWPICKGEIALLKEENKQLRSELEQVKKTLAKTVKELGEVKDKLHLWEHTVFVRQAVKAFEKRVCFLINYDCKGSLFDCHRAAFPDPNEKRAASQIAKKTENRINVCKE